MNAPPFLTSHLLDGRGVSHGFFSRVGGISEGALASLNTGFGAGDNVDNVAENRQRCARALGVAPGRLLTPYQTHSSDVLVVEEQWPEEPIEADALVTQTPGLAIGVVAADCMPVLFFDPKTRLIGVAHAGWRGALAGILENTVATMQRLGAEPANIRAVLGPCLRQPNFEVGLDLLSAFTEKFPQAKRFFEPGRSDEKRQLDLAGFGAWRLQQAGVSQFDDIEQCTLAAAQRFFSYRAMKRDNGSDYGRNLSAIVLG